MQRLVALAIAIGVLTATTAQGWDEIQPGLEWGEFTSPVKGSDQPLVVRALRIDTSRFGLSLGAAVAQSDVRARSLRSWCRDRNWVAAINAGMFQENMRSVSYMQDGNLVVNPRVSKDKSVLAFNCESDSLPGAVIIDVQCDDLESWKLEYRTFVQSIRMLSCTGNNVWEMQDRKFSVAAVGVDDQDRVLFLHMKRALPVHTLIETLQQLPLDLKRCMYAEGGAHAQLFVKSGDWEQELVGEGAWAPIPVPNVIGVFSK